MTPTIKSCFVLLIALVALTSCKTTGVITTNKQLPQKSVPYLLNKLNENLPQITWLDGRANVSITVEGRSQKFSSQIRIRRDSVFLANGKKLSTEGGRIQITRDSFHLLNRIQKTIETKSFDHVTTAYAIPLDFDQLMNVILGFPTNPIEAEKFVASSKDGRYHLRGHHQQLDVSYFLDGRDYQLVGIEIKDKLSQQRCTVVLDDYRNFGDFRLSGLRTFMFDNGVDQPIIMKVDFSKIDLNVPKSIKFSVPPRYTKLD